MFWFGRDGCQAERIEAWDPTLFCGIKLVEDLKRSVFQHTQSGLLLSDLRGCKNSSGSVLKLQALTNLRGRGWGALKKREATEMSELCATELHFDSSFRSPDADGWHFMET